MGWDSVEEILAGAEVRARVKDRAAELHGSGVDVYTADDYIDAEGEVLETVTDAERRAYVEVMVRLEGVF